MYIIFIFSIEENEEEKEIKKDETSLFKQNIEYYIEKITKKKGEIIFNENLFYAGLDKEYSENLLNYFLKDIKLNNQEIKDLLIKAKYKPKNIKFINLLLHQGKSVDEIIKKEKLFSPRIELNENKLSYSLCYLLMAMPSGLPDCFLQLIFDDDYTYINDNKNLIIKSRENNWNIINKDKIV